MRQSKIIIMYKNLLLIWRTLRIRTDRKISVLAALLTIGSLIGDQVFWKLAV